MSAKLTRLTNTTLAMIIREKGGSILRRLQLLKLTKLTTYSILPSNQYLPKLFKLTELTNHFNHSTFDEQFFIFHKK